MDETVEEDVVEEIKEQVVEQTPPVNARGESEYIGEGGASKSSESKTSVLETSSSSSLKFNDVDSVLNKDNKQEVVSAPKTIERLEEISALRNMQRKMEEESDDEKLNISDQDVELTGLDVHELQPEVKLDEFLLDDIEILS
jgi:hypothetical protein